MNHSDVAALLKPSSFQPDNVEDGIFSRASSKKPAMKNKQDRRHAGALAVRPERDRAKQERAKKSRHLAGKRVEPEHFGLLVDWRG